MVESGPLINLGDLTKPATVLIEKISDAIGTLYLPRQIKRIAAAEAEADKIRAVAEIEVSEIQRRALVRLIEEEGKKQENIERISAQAIGELSPDAKPENIEKDWLAHFFDRSKLISDAEMQSLWSRLLAGEANHPGTFSTRTIETVATLQKADARLFTVLCGFGWSIGPLVFDLKEKVYLEHGITFGMLNHLESIGLISFNSVTDYFRQNLPQDITVHYFGTPVCIKFSQPSGNQLPLGTVIFTQVGWQLAPISGSGPVDGFQSYVLSQWLQPDLSIFSPWPKVPDSV
jgi:Protein of unknown function (DUF2806)